MKTKKQLLADENFPGLAVNAIRSAGYDIVWIRESYPGISDLEVITKAIEDKRLLITFDKDFGELAFRSGLSPENGIILFRISQPSAKYITRFALDILNSDIEFSGNFTVVEEHRIRVKQLLFLS